MSDGPGREVALHLRISADLAHQIRTGAWPAGHRIPFEHELMAAYGCARATVNKAVQALVAAGLVERRRRAGSFVARPPVQSAVLEIRELEAEVASRGQAYGYALLSRRLRAIDRGDPDESMLAAAATVLELRCRHSADGQSFALEERLISLSAVPEAARADFVSHAPGSWLLDHVAWSDAEHRIGAVSADTLTAARLGVPAGQACLSLRRWTWRDGEPVTFVRLTFPAAAFELCARFTPKAFT